MFNTMTLSFKERLRNTIINIKTSIIFSIVNSIKSPLYWSSVFWDGYNRSEFPDNIMRLFRVLIGVLTVIKIIRPFWLGLFLVIDGAYAIYRYRFEIPETKHWYEDIPRGARFLLGVVLILGFI